MSCLPGGISGFVGSRLAITQRRHAVKATHRAWPIQPVHLASTVYASGVDRWIAAVYVLTQGWALITAGSMMRKMDARQLAVPNTAENLPPTQYHISGARKRSPTTGGRTAIRHTACKEYSSGPALLFRKPSLLLGCSPCTKVTGNTSSREVTSCNQPIKDAVSNSSCYEPASLHTQPHTLSLLLSCAAPLLRPSIHIRPS